ncbi:protein amnionless [Armigeres subalbatus]|uniref:protein amnionless n=1 Tax=Armigeres subalbatus TaxID=124917 RepID=UPI002ED263EE
MDTLIWLLIIIVSINYSFGTKLWRNNLDFNDRSNWQSNELPKSGQSIQYPAKLNALVELPTSFSVGSLILPTTGAVLVPETDFSLHFESDHRHRETTVFKTPARKPYYSTANWKAVDNSGKAVSGPNGATPHLERIPCQYEAVLFGKIPSPIDLQYHSAIEVKEINYGGAKGLDEFRRFLVSDLGQYVFYNGEETLVTEGKCSSPEKCPCQPEWVLEAVCANEVCPVPHCLSPIVPKGHCCAICGSVLSVDLGNFVENFDFNDFSRKLARKITSAEVDQSEVEYHISVENYALQLVIIDREEYSEQSVDLMKSLEPYFVMRFQNGHKIVHAGHPHIPYQSGQLFLVIFVSLLAISIFFTILYAYYYDDKVVPRLTAVIRNRTFFSSPFVFARFDPNNAHDDSTVDINFNPSGIENLNSSFNNPMFEENDKDAASSSKAAEHNVEKESYVDVELDMSK